MEKDNRFGAVLITVIVLLFAGCLFVLNKQGYLSFKGNETRVNNDINNIVKDTDIVENNDIRYEKTIMSYDDDEEIDMLNSILGVWANVDDGDGEWCNGTVFEVFKNLYVYVGHFRLNSEPNQFFYLSYKKIDSNKYELNLAQPFTGVEYRGWTTKCIIDLSKIKDNILIVEDTEYKYVGEPGTDVCKWYKDNH